MARTSLQRIDRFLLQRLPSVEFDRLAQSQRSATRLHLHSSGTIQLCPGSHARCLLGFVPCGTLLLALLFYLFQVEGR